MWVDRMLQAGMPKMVALALLLLAYTENIKQEKAGVRRVSVRVLTQRVLLEWGLKHGLRARSCNRAHSQEQPVEFSQ